MRRTRDAQQIAWSSPMEPHERSATVEVMAGDEAAIGGTDRAGHQALLRYARKVVDVPPIVG